ncbi:hypothetical protein WME76_23275 [Sorangium sp. So ce119]
MNHAEDWDETLKRWAETINTTDEARSNGACETIRSSVDPARTGYPVVE